jgi:hypothetical protein
VLVVVSTGLSIIIPISLRLVFTSFNQRLRLFGALGHNLLFFVFIFIFRDSATGSNSSSNLVAVPSHVVLELMNFIKAVASRLDSNALSFCAAIFLWYALRNAFSGILNIWKLLHKPQPNQPYVEIPLAELL